MPDTAGDFTHVASCLGLPDLNSGAATLDPIIGSAWSGISWSTQAEYLPAERDSSPTTSFDLAGSDPFMTFQLDRVVTDLVVEPLVAGLTRCGDTVGWGYARVSGTMRHMVMQTGVRDADNANAFVGRSEPGANEPFTPDYLKPHRGDAAQPLETVTVDRARLQDSSGIARSHVLGIRRAYQDLAVQGRLDEFALNLGERRSSFWRHQVAEGETIFVARSADGDVAGFIHPQRMDDGTGYIDAWYLRPEWHRTGVSELLMRQAREYLGPVDINLHVVEGTAAVRAYERRGFVRTGATLPTAPQATAYGIVAPMIELVLRHTD
ncbi:GNAT family N-acetyltransferase [Nocardia sp. GCM10030253]|uniref:GNAT family N-acetyltransferase n=1 Tax=Nocardia sp. GCM10030253 TaxID=3273404 RepID=UPI003631DFFC